MTTRRVAQLVFAIAAVASVLGSTLHALVGAPILNTNQAVLTSGPTVTLSWTPSATGTPTSYIVEASSTPGGPADIANFNTGNTQTTLVIPNVPAGTYFVRVRSADASGSGAPSNEVQVIVATAGTCPSAPRGLNVASQSGGAITLAWQPPLTGAPASYVVQAGSTTGAANLASFDTNSTALSLAATVPAGSYFVRIYARSSDCAAPSFLGPASNEILLSVGASLGAPVLNNNQPVLASGPTLTLSWTPPATGVPTSYFVEASSTPGGPANLANVNTGNTQTSLVTANVPPGTYYVRVRAASASGQGGPSNEVQVVVSGTGGGVCPSAPRGLNVVSQSGGAITLAWQAPLTGVPVSYVVQAGSVPGAANLTNVDTGSTALGLATTVPTGSYFVRVYARSSDCTGPSFLGPASNEVLLSVGGTPGWGGQIECRVAITGPSGYHHDETQTWFVSGPAQVISSARTNYHVVWTAQGSGGGPGTSWSINSTSTTDLSATVVASTGIPIFDRTTAPITIIRGIVGSPTSFDLHEIDFATIVAPSAAATLVTGTWGRPTSGGDSPQQPGGSVGTLACTWSLRYQ